MRNLLAIALCGLAACGGPPYRASEKPADRVAAVDSTVLVVLDDDVKWGIELVDHRELMLPDGRLRAQLRLRNKTPSDQHVQLAWTFKDDANFAVEATTPFMHHLIAAGQTIDLTRDSLARGATRFHVEVKTAKSAQD